MRPRSSRTSPAQNFSKPPPVPDVPTVTLTPVFAVWNSWAATVDRGATVLDPSTLIVPASLPPSPLPDDPASAPPQALAASITAAVTASGTLARRSEVGMFT